MRLIIFLFGLLSLLAGIIVAGSIKSDIQVQIFATCLIGAVLMFGQVAILSGQKSIRKSLQQTAKNKDVAGQR